MKRPIELIIIAGLVLQAVLFTGCSKMRSSKDAANIARFGSDYLTLNEAQENMPHFSLKGDSTEALKAYRKQWVRQHLILKEASRLHLANQKEVQRKLKEAHKEVLQQALQQSVTSHFKKTFTVSDSEVHHYFQQHKKKWLLDERYIMFRHIATDQLSKARRARKALQQDSSWVDVANKYSLMPQKKIAMSTRIWPASDIARQVPVMKRYVSQLDSGQYSPIRRSDGIYHFIELIQVHDAGSIPDEDWFSAQIKEWLIREKERNYYHSYLKNLYFKAKKNNELELYNVDQGIN